MKNYDQFTHGKLKVSSEQDADRVNSLITKMVKEIKRQCGYLPIDNQKNVSFLIDNIIFANTQIDTFECTPRKLKTPFMDDEWILTDSASNQYGRQISEHVFEFKEGDDEGIYEVNLLDYNVGIIENCINSYGYTLSLNPPKGLQNIATQYAERASWIIAECIFESVLIRVRFIEK